MKAAVPHPETSIKQAPSARSVASGLAHGGALGLLLASAMGAALPQADSLQIVAPALLPMAMMLAFAAALGGDSLGVRLLGWSWLATAIAWSCVLTTPLRTAITSPPAEGHRVPLRIVSFNAYRYNRQIPIAIDWIEAQNPDVVVLLEAMVADNAAYAPLRRDFPFAESCAPQLRCSTVVLAKRPFRNVWRHTRGDPENRKALSALTVLVDAGCSTFPLTAAHLSRPWPLGLQEPEFRLLEPAMKTRGRGGVLVGDFNSAPWTFAMRRIAQAGGVHLVSGTATTWPSSNRSNPWLPLDQAYAGTSTDVTTVSRGPHLGSDHRPLVIDLTVACTPSSLHRTMMETSPNESFSTTKPKVIIKYNFS